MQKFHRSALAANIDVEDIDVAAVREQLARLLSDPLFHRSERYPAFLTYVVDSVLNTPSQKLKEQTVGIDVFGKPPGYDTSRDHIVRSTAVEIRKRLKQYYGRPDHQGEIVIELPVGCYTPRFYKFNGTSPVSGPTGFWHPVLAQSQSVIVCVSPLIPPDLPEQPNRAETVTDMHTGDKHRVALADAISMSRVVSFISSQRKRPEMRGSDELTFRDFDRNPVVLIGALNNKWTCRLTQQLRFTFRFDLGARVAYVQDAQSPNERTGAVGFLERVTEFKEDFAIITRLIDPSIGKPVVAIGDITMLGTSAAANFITDTGSLSLIEEQAPPGWAAMNLQLVLSTRIVEGCAGPAQIVTTKFWRN